MTHENSTLTYELMKVSPPATVAGVSLAGVALQDWVLIATLCYTLLNAFFLVRDRVYLPWKAKRNGSD